MDLSQLSEEISNKLNENAQDQQLGWRAAYPGEQDCDCGSCTVCSNGTLPATTRLDGTLLMVEWEDSSYAMEGYWARLQEAQNSDTIKVVSVGFVAHHNHHRLVLSQSYTGLEMGSLFSIPNSAVRRIVRLQTSEAPQDLHKMLSDVHEGVDAIENMLTGISVHNDRIKEQHAQIRGVVVDRLAQAGRRLRGLQQRLRERLSER